MTAARRLGGGESWTERRLHAAVLV
eukprot:COSAG01_NODE_78424_length_146_cov_28.234043_1_plen_24_part_10